MGEQPQELGRIIGPDRFSDDASDLAAYAADKSFAVANKPSLVVRPDTHDEVQHIVAWANDTVTALVPVSSGPPHFHGDTVPSVAGAVVVDLTNMKKILRIDRRNRMCVVEPGVTYAALQPALAEHGMRVTPPLLPRANKSVLASLLERQPTLIPRYNFHLPEPLRDCGVVWGNGEAMYTGEAGSGPLSLEDQWNAGLRQIDPKGPAQTDFFRLLTGAQGSMGIVTWASLKCELVPTVHKLTFVAAAELADLLPLVYRLNRVRLGDEVLVLDRAYLARLLGALGCGILAGELPPWTLIVGLGGREHLAAERVEVAENDARSIAEQVGLSLRLELCGASVSSVQAALSSCCKTPWKLAAKGGSADVFFLTTLDKAPGFIETARELAVSLGLTAADVGVYIQPQHQGVSHHVELSLPYDPSDAVEGARAQKFHDVAGERLIASGAYFSRPYGSWSHPVYRRDAASREALCKAKRIFDPLGIMNPGKLCFGALAVREEIH